MRSVAASSSSSSRSTGPPSATRARTPGSSAGRSPINPWLVAVRLGAAAWWSFCSASILRRRRSTRLCWFPIPSKIKHNATVQAPAKSGFHQVRSLLHQRRACSWRAASSSIGERRAPGQLRSTVVRSSSSLSTRVGGALTRPSPARKWARDDIRQDHRSPPTGQCE